MLNGESAGCELTESREVTTEAEASAADTSEHFTIIISKINTLTLPENADHTILLTINTIHTVLCDWHTCSHATCVVAVKPVIICDAHA